MSTLLALTLLLFAYFQFKYSLEGKRKIFDFVKQHKMPT